MQVFDEIVQHVRDNPIEKEITVPEWGKTVRIKPVSTEGYFKAEQHRKNSGSDAEYHVDLVAMSVYPQKNGSAESDQLIFDSDDGRQFLRTQSIGILSDITTQLHDLMDLESGEDLAKN